MGRQRIVRPPEPPKPPRVPGPSRLPEGPRIARVRTTVVGGPGEPPPGFVTATTSKTEWVVYWGLARIFDNPRDPRQGPFLGGFPDWEWQGYAMGGRSAPGGAVLDFVVRYTPRGRPLGIRVQTEFWHLFTPEQMQARDVMQKAALEAEYDIADLYDYELLATQDGSAAIIRLKQVIGLIERPDPLSAGTAERVGRPLDMPRAR